MVQASRESITNRRSFVTGLIGSTVVIATAGAATMGRDPVLAAIQVHVGATVHLTQCIAQNEAVASVANEAKKRFKHDLHDGWDFNLVEVNGAKRQCFKTWQDQDLFDKALKTGRDEIDARHGLSGAEENLDRAHDLESSALDEMVNTAPTTREGAIALLEYITSPERSREVEDFAGAMATVLRFLKAS